MCGSDVQCFRTVVEGSGVIGLAVLQHPAACTSYDEYGRYSKKQIASAKDGRKKPCSL